jgi:hypothetical protein
VTEYGMAEFFIQNAPVGWELETKTLSRFLADILVLNQPAYQLVKPDHFLLSIVP